LSTISSELHTLLHYGRWDAALKWLIIFGLFIAFLPFHKKSKARPRGIYLAFIVASALEMYGIPLSLYFITWAFGISTPVGIFWGHTLVNLIGRRAMLIGYILNIIGGALIILGWRRVFTLYWGKSKEERRLVTDGIYAFSRHPQYLGFILMTLGLLVHWATIPLFVMWPLLVYRYYTLAKSEEKEMEEEFGEAYREYKRKAPMFLSIRALLGSSVRGAGYGKERFLLRTFASAIGLLSVYVVVLTLGNSFEHALSELIKWWPWLLFQLMGFGIQMSMFFHMRDLSKLGKWRGSASSLAVGGGVSASTMIACCLHHVTDVLPIIGLSAATLLLTQYQSLFMSLGVLANLVGIIIMLENLQQHTDFEIIGNKLSGFLSGFDLKRVRNITAVASVLILLILSASALGVLPAARAKQEDLEISDTKNGVMFTFRQISYGEDALAFETRIDTHEGALSFEMTEVATLEVGGDAYPPIRWEGSPPGGHHRSGILVFPDVPQTAEMRIVVRDVYGVPEWVFDLGSPRTESTLGQVGVIGIMAISLSAVLLISKSKNLRDDEHYNAVFQRERARK
jgi:protein-S-isoprenylcysteine O-methyltransferase Ste14